ncbi:MAG: molybdopterin-binding protein [Adlercreutzia sp.]|uniref:molybdopterin-binding protein n=1 Tax=uncultured Adlercreutzia sp. TaxID=875803 RepID=UPI00216F349C|nr:molybdopterin-binding protein [uncultured Adlercreutzia sp.]MCI8424797.1 molybdopterin-binding protein [Adlercreutzia sp.]
MIAPMQVQVGRPVRFEGYAEDYGCPIVAVQFSLDGGDTWTDYDVSGSTGDLWVHWTFEYTPERPGAYCLLVRSVNERGEASPEPDIAEFTAFEA